MTGTNNKGTLLGQVFCIGLSVLLSWLIAMSADLVELELGALVNMFYPLLIGLFSIIAFLLAARFLNHKKWLAFVFVLMMLINIACGLYIRFGNL